MCCDDLMLRGLMNFRLGQNIAFIKKRHIACVVICLKWIARNIQEDQMLFLLKASVIGKKEKI